MRSCGMLQYDVECVEQVNNDNIANSLFTMKKQSNNNDLISPGMAWLTVFVPALSFFIATRFSSLHSGGALLGTPVTTHIDPIYKNKFLNDVFYLKPDLVQLQYPLMLIDDSFEDVVASTWKHDAELGRGFLLLSQAHEQGRIWRWERGGGPIPIGKSLAMDPSGCRSKSHCKEANAQHGSGGVAIDFHKQESFREGSLVVAEWGEGRIVRLEEETGARTPLVINVPDACKHASARPKRVEQVAQMLYTPFGDLIFVEPDCSAVMRLQQAAHVPPLESSMTSRVAHKWNSTRHEHPINVLYKETDVGAISLDAKGEGLFVTVKSDDGSVLLVQLSLLEDEDDEEDVSADAGDTVRIVFNLTAEANLVEPPRAMTVDETGHVFLTIPTGVLIVEEGRNVLGKLATPTPITSLTLGEDKYLYVTTPTQLLRISVRHGPPKYPTKLVPKKPTIKKKI